MRTGLLSLLILCILSTMTLRAQVGAGNLEGRILDANGEPLPVVNVLVNSSSM